MTGVLLDAEYRNNKVFSRMLAGLQLVDGESIGGSRIYFVCSGFVSEIVFEGKDPL